MVAEQVLKRRDVLAEDRSWTAEFRTENTDRFSVGFFRKKHASIGTAVDLHHSHEFIVLLKTFVDEDRITQQPTHWR